VNFASERLGNLDSPGVQTLVDRILSGSSDSLTAAEMVASALDELSINAVSDKTQSALVDFAEQQLARTAGEPKDDGDDAARRQVANVLKLVGATPEFQRA
jgi:hypothetical protein